MWICLSDFQAALGLWAGALRLARKVRVSSCWLRPSRLEEGQCRLQLSRLLARCHPLPSLIYPSACFYAFDRVATPLHLTFRWWTEEQMWNSCSALCRCCQCVLWSTEQSKSLKMFWCLKRTLSRISAPIRHGESWIDLSGCSGASRGAATVVIVM